MAILDFLAPDDPLTAADIRRSLETTIDGAGAEALPSLRERLLADAGWDYYPPDPLARRIHHLLAERFLHANSAIEGDIDFAPLLRGRTVLLANHLSYADANVIEVLLRRAGADTLANRMTAIAGPKVFTNRQRRFSSLCFGTVKVPQSADVSSEDVVLNPRELARAARQAINAANARLDDGDALVLFAEGTRTRTGAMGPLLPGAARYLESRDIWVVPVGLVGSEDLFPMGASTVRPARAVVRIGEPIHADALFERAGRNRKTVMDAIGIAIAELLPAAYRGAYTPGARSSAARDALDAARH